VARNFKELQDKMDPAARAENDRLLCEERRIALEKVRGAERLIEAEPGSTAK
jgi:hypothetical protein